VGREYCQTCESLKELYRLKLNQFLLAARSVSAWPNHGRTAREEELQALKDESLEALRRLLQHMKICYGVLYDEVA
jgi:hypothetical protein